MLRTARAASIGLGLARPGGGARRRDRAAHRERGGAAAHGNLGLDRGPPARIPDAASPYIDDACHALRTSESVDTGCASSAAAQRRTAVLLRLLGEVFHGRLAVDAREQQSREQRRGPRLDVGEGNALQVRARQGVEAAEIAGFGLRHPQALEKQMIQAEGEIESRIPVPRALCVQKYGALGPDEDVLRAHVAVDHAHLRPGGALDKLVQARLQRGVAQAGGHEVGLEADGVEDVVGRKARRHAGGCGMDRGERAAHFGGESLVRNAVAQQGFPHGIARRVEILHDKGAFALREHPRHGRRRSRACCAQPLVFEAVALDRRFPELRDAQPGQRALDAHRAAGEIDPPDIRRDAAAQGLSRRGLVGAAQADAPQEFDDVRAHGFRR